MNDRKFLEDSEEYMTLIRREFPKLNHVPPTRILLNNEQGHKCKLQIHPPPGHEIVPVGDKKPAAKNNCPEGGWGHYRPKELPLHHLKAS
tara:strand:- start:310 stop:579 length:270 start_codon:yes stop_codon:yes gene_type:complete